MVCDATTDAFPFPELHCYHDVSAKILLLLNPCKKICEVQQNHFEETFTL